MKNLIFLINVLLLLSVSTLFAQTEKKEFPFELNIATKLVHQTPKNPDAGEFSDDLSLSLELSHLLNSKGQFVFKYGLSYNLIQLNHVDYLAAFFDCDTEGPGTFFIKKSWIRNDIKIHYLGIPIDFKVNPLKDDEGIYFKIGLEAMIKFHQNTDSFLVMCGEPEVDTENEENTKTFSTPLRVRSGIGYEFLVGTKYQMFVELNYEFISTNMYENPAVIAGFVNNVRIREYGIRLGVRI